MGTPHLPSVRTTVLTGIGMKSLLLLSLVCFAAGQDVPRKIRDQMAQWNFQERCWGYETMTQISLQLFKAQEYCNTLAPLHSMDHSTMTKPFFPTSSQFRRPRPVHKYDAAVVSMMVLYDAAPPEEEFVNDFFWGK